MALRAPWACALRPLRAQIRRQPTSCLRNPIRKASTSAPRTDDLLVSRLKNAAFGTSLALFLSFGYLYATDTRASAHQWLVVPAIRLLYPDAEDAHHAGGRILKALYSFGIHPRERGNPDATGDLAVEVFGHTLANPIGTSGGIDKDAEIPSPLLALGPAVVEVGGVTARPQEGNPRPRVFRLPSQHALINRYGLNSEGAEFVAMRLRQRVREFAYALGIGSDEEAERIVLDGEAGVPPGSLVPGKLLAVQIAKNKTTPDEDIEAVKADYVFCVQNLGRYADIIVVNVSSPNTPGLRSLQRVEPLTRILSGVVEAAQAVPRKSKPAVMVKVSPDEDTDEQVNGICEAIWESGVDGVIVGNTTKQRPAALPKGFSLPPKESRLLLEQGGYSGPQLFDKTLGLIKRYRKLLDEGPKRNNQSDEGPAKPADDTAPESEAAEKPASIVEKATESLKSVKENVVSALPSPPTKTDIPADKVIFASGGITNGKQALEVLNAGASVAMIYTALVYGGSGKITRIKQEMREEIKSKKA